MVIVAASVGAFAYALSGRVDLLMALIMLVAASLGAQLGAAATRYVRASGIRFLYGVIVLCGGAAVALHQAAETSGLELLSAVGSIALLGMGGSVCLLLMVMLIRARRAGGDGG